MARCRLLGPFEGSGSEMIGAMQAGWDEIVGVEQDAHYCDIARARLAHAAGPLLVKGQPTVAEPVGSAQQA